MPLYEYRCKECGKVIEIIQKFSDPPLLECEVCGGSLERLLSPAAIQFKGSGWYVTDYARNNGKGSSEKESASSKEEKEKEKETKAQKNSETKNKSAD